MYNDNAILDIDKFEMVAKEYAKQTRANILSVNYNNLIKTINDIWSQLNNFYKTSNNKANKQKINEIIENYKLFIDEFKQENNLDFDLQINENNNLCYCDYIKTLIKCYFELIKFMNENKSLNLKYEQLEKIISLTLELFGKCKFRIF